MLIVSLLAGIKPVIEEPFPSAEQIWAIGGALLALWFFAIGASVGSFLNVVVYRLPLGLSLSNPGSRCPRCLHPIRLQHNLPILGWLMLRGRCADCQLPISPRYPRVEFLLGVIFLIVGGMEVLSNGLNFPRPTPGTARNVLTTLESKPLGAAAAMHLVLIATLVCGALIEFDRQLIPKRLALPTILFAIAASLTWPALHPIAALDLLNATHRLHFVDLPNPSRWILQSPLIDIALGGMAGLLAAGLIKFTIGSRQWLWSRYGSIIALLWIAIGVVFGWQLIPLLLAAWSILQISISGDAEKLSIHPIRDLALVTLLAMLTWRWIAVYPQVINPSLIGQLSAYGLVTLLAIALLSVATFRLPREYAFPLPIIDEAFQPTPPAPLPDDATTIEVSAPSPDEPTLS
ncbi:prepilin peptidase [Anatilimnocola floriformis]|uniref:prepilin peptidase n=1 Tax=Anatilimnocola floriformis TaxID=2948575 RepID=UPI0020C1D7B0|nr:A24 family peptidase [Anatilimnocola floriformis]